VLGEDREAVVVRPGHPLAAGPVTLERIFAFPFLVVELTGSGDPGTEGFLDDRGVWRRVWIDRLLIETGHGGELVGHVAVSVPYYAAVPPMLAETDMVASLPLRLARRAVEAGQVVMLDLPYEPLTVPFEVIWHQRADRDPAVQWLIGELGQCLDGPSG
jgi:DNA-binding transcriptional LysR family regulator